MKQALNDADITWYFMHGESSSNLACEGTPTQKSNFYGKDGKTPVSAQVIVKEIPVDGSKYSYYWNLNSGINCDGELLMASPKDIGFKDSRKTISWQRVAVFADGDVFADVALRKNDGIIADVGPVFNNGVGPYAHVLPQSGFGADYGRGVDTGGMFLKLCVYVSH